MPDAREEAELIDTLGAAEANFKIFREKSGIILRFYAIRIPYPYTFHKDFFHHFAKVIETVEKSSIFDRNPISPGYEPDQWEFVTVTLYLVMLTHIIMNDIITIGKSFIS